MQLSHDRQAGRGGYSLGMIPLVTIGGGNIWRSISRMAWRWAGFSGKELVRSSVEDLAALRAARSGSERGVRATVGRVHGAG
jgi:hypothetical protein